MVLNCVCFGNYLYVLKVDAMFFYAKAAVSALVERFTPAIGWAMCDKSLCSLWPDSECLLVSQIDVLLCTSCLGLKSLSMHIKSNISQSSSKCGVLVSSLICFL